MINKAYCYKNYYFENKLLFEENKLYNVQYEVILTDIQSYPKSNHAIKFWIEYNDIITNKRKQHSFFLIENNFSDRNFKDYFITLKQARKLKIKNITIKDDDTR